MAFLPASTKSSLRCPWVGSRDAILEELPPYGCSSLADSQNLYGVGDTPTTRRPHMHTFISCKIMKVDWKLCECFFLHLAQSIIIPSAIHSSWYDVDKQSIYGASWQRRILLKWVLNKNPYSCRLEFCSIKRACPDKAPVKYGASTN